MNLIVLRPITYLLLATLLSIGFVRCGGGGNNSFGVVDGGSSGGNGSGSDNSGGGSLGDGSSKWQVLASVSKNGCGERISDVNQTVDIASSNGQVVVNTGIVTTAGESTADGFTLTYNQTTGTCTRAFHVEFSSMSDSSAVVMLSKAATCDGNACENQWVGSASRIQ